MKQVMKFVVMLFVVSILTTVTTGFIPAKSPTKVHTYTEKGKFVLRWSGLGDGCQCPNCKCPGCPCPLGMCTCGGVAMYTGGTLEADEGTASFTMNENGTMTIVFDQQTGLRIPSISEHYDVVPITGTLEFSSEMCEALGQSSIKISNGYYQVSYLNSEFGTITLTPTVE